MNLEQLSYLAQIVGVVLVVVSLVYVARQLRQSTEMARVGAGANWLELNFAITDPMISSRELAEIWFKGETGLDTLDEVDKRRLMFFELRGILSWHYLFQLNEKGLLPASDLSVMEGIVRAVRHRQSVQGAWKQFRDSFSKSFRDYLDERLKI